MYKSIFLIIFSLFVYTSENDVKKEQISITVSNPNQQGLLTVKHQKGSISVQGYHGSVVLVDSKFRYESDNDDDGDNYDGGDQDGVPLGSQKPQARQAGIVGPDGGRNGLIGILKLEGRERQEARQKQAHDEDVKEEAVQVGPKP